MAMRIVYPLLWSRTDRRACTEQSINTSAALARRGLELTLLMPKGPHDPSLSPDALRGYFEVEGDFAVVQRSCRSIGNAVVPSSLWLRRVLADPAVASADVLLSRIPNMLVAGPACPIPYATDHYRPWPDDWPILRPLVRRTSRDERCVGFIVHSEYAAESYRRTGVAEDKILVAHNGADTARMEPVLDKTAARAVLGLPVERPIAVYAGRINAKKGLERLLEIADLRLEVLFLLVGSEDEGPIEAAARSRPNVRIFPWQPPRALAPFLYAADVLVVPPSRAPLERHRNCVLPLKLFAYLSAGRPVLAPALPDTAELLRDGENALLVVPDDSASAARALDRLIHEPSLAARLAAAGLNTAAKLTWDRRAETIAGFLERRLLAARAVAAAPSLPVAVPA